MTSNSTHRGSDDRGFTLIELMVVVLIIAILLAIAIPTFLGSQNKAKDRSAQSSARNALTNAKTLYADTGLYTSATVASLATSEPSLTFSLIASTGPKNVSVDSTSAVTWYAAVKSDTGTCFYVRDSVDLVNPTAGTTYAKATVAGAITCLAGEAGVAYSANGWG